jgi:hypothetical protein
MVCYNLQTDECIGTEGICWNNTAKILLCGCFTALARVPLFWWGLLLTMIRPHARSAAWPQFSLLCTRDYAALSLSLSLSDTACDAANSVYT